jgi:hypothetical protein
MYQTCVCGEKSHCTSRNYAYAIGLTHIHGAVMPALSGGCSRGDRGEVGHEHRAVEGALVTCRILLPAKPEPLLCAFG